MAPNKKNVLSISTEMAYISQVKLIGDRSIAISNFYLYIFCSYGNIKLWIKDTV